MYLSFSKCFYVLMFISNIRFICLSSTLPFAENGGLGMKAISVVEEKAQPIVRMIKAVVFQPRAESENTRARAD